MYLLDNPPSRIQQPQPSPPIKQIQMPQNLKLNQEQPYQSRNNFRSQHSIASHNNNLNNSKSTIMLKGSKVSRYSPVHFNINNSTLLNNQIGNSQNANQPLNRQSINPQRVSNNNIRFTYNSKSLNVPRTHINNSLQFQSGNRSVFNSKSSQCLSKIYSNQQSRLHENHNVRKSDLSLMSKQQNYSNQKVNTFVNFVDPVNKFKKDHVSSSNSQSVTIHQLGKKSTKLSKIQQRPFEEASRTNKSPFNQLCSHQQSQIIGIGFQNQNVIASSNQYQQKQIKWENIQLEPEEYLLSQRNVPNSSNVKTSANIRKTDHQNLAQLNLRQQQPPIEQNRQQVHLVTQQQQIDQPLMFNSSRAESQGQRKINNKAYLQGDSVKMSELKKIQDKISRIQKIKQSQRLKTQTQGYSPHKILESRMENKQSSQQLNAVIARYQQIIHKKQEQNQILAQKLRNLQLKQKVYKDQKQLQIICKMNQIDIKKLKNSLKMCQIKQKLFENKEVQYVQKIKQLQNQLNKKAKIFNNS